MIGIRVGREVRVARRPVGWPEAADFEIAEVPVAGVGRDQILVRNLIMSVDPYMRNRMNGIGSYVPGYKIGKPLDGGVVGEVVRAETDKFSPGDLVGHDLGWREFAVMNASQAAALDTSTTPPSAYLGVLGMPGITAYAGIRLVAKVRPGETVFISSAAGAVGSVAGQIAKICGARKVVGSVGSALKQRLLTTELNFDSAINYRDGPIDAQLRNYAPAGVDVYFDNVGADHLEGAIAAMNPHGRIAACGMIAGYNSLELNHGPRNIMQVIAKRITIQGYIVDDFGGQREEILGELTGWFRAGKLKYRETVIDGLSNAPGALIGLMRGEYVGKVLVRIAEHL